jgi:hypothetical protein
MKAVKSADDGVTLVDGMKAIRVDGGELRPM